MAETVDAEVHNAYMYGGMTYLNHYLDTNDGAEHMLSRIGAEVHLRLTKDYVAYRNILTAKPPGNSDILPSWCTTEARDTAKALHNQKKRAGGKEVRSSSEEDQSFRRRRRGGRRRDKTEKGEKDKGTEKGAGGESGKSGGGGGGGPQKRNP